MKVEIGMEKFPSIAYPKLSIIATCGVDDVNGIALTWHTPISKNPPLYAISVSPKRYSHKLISENEEFALNFLPFKFWKELNYCGTHTGRGENKFERLGLNLERCKKINTKMIGESYASMECSLYEKIELGDHTVFVGEVLAY